MCPVWTRGSQKTQGRRFSIIKKRFAVCSFTAKWNHSRGFSLSLSLSHSFFRSICENQSKLKRNYSKDICRGSRIKNSNEQLFLLCHDRSTEYAIFASKLTLRRVIPVCESSYRCHYARGRQMFFISWKIVWPCIFLFFNNLHRLRLQQALINPIVRWLSCFNSWPDHHWRWPIF